MATFKKMMMPLRKSERLAKRVFDAESELSDIRMMQRRQTEYVGLRLGVFARLRELERDERRVAKRRDKAVMAFLACPGADRRALRTA